MNDDEEDELKRDGERDSDKRFARRVAADGAVSVSAAIKTLTQLGIAMPKHFEDDEPLPPRVHVTGEDELARRRDAKANASRERLNALRDYGWPARALRYAQAPRATHAIDSIESWQRARSKTIVVLAGNKGIGKTVAAAWHALFHPSNVVMRFVRAATILRMSRFGPEWDARLKAPALCIDDLGAEYIDEKGSFVSDIDELVDTFYADERRLIITTNLDGKTFRERYRDRVTDRLRECGMWIEATGPSLRGTEPDEESDQAP